MHQGSSPTTIFSAVIKMAIGNDSIAHQLTLVEDQLKTLKKANKALSKRQRAKQTCIQEGGTCTRDAAAVLIATKEAKQSKRQKRSRGEGDEEASSSASQCCRKCRQAGHNVRTCPKAKEDSKKDCIEVAT